MSGGSLRGPRLRLRRFGHDDLDDLAALDSDPEVMRYLTGGKPTERAVIEREILPLFIAGGEHHPLFGFWAAEAAGRFVGWLAFRPSSADGRTVSLGYRFARQAWGHGFATEGAKLLVDEGFERHGVDRVVATTYEENHASVRVLERLGMRLERRFRYTPDDLAATDTSRPDAGDLWPGDDLQFVLDRSDWAAIRRDNPADGPCA